MPNHRQASGRRATLADVAAQAGVSAATASRALGFDSRISAMTQARVRDAADTLEYVPNLAARSLRVRRTRTLGLLLADLSDPVHAQVVAGFELQAAEAGYTVIIGAAGGDVRQERRSLTAFIERGTDGICIASGAMDPNDVASIVRSSPLAFIQPEHSSVAMTPEHVPDGTIRADDASGMAQVVRHLVAGGHRDIAYLGAGEGATNRLRRSAALAALRVEADRVVRTFQVAEDGWTSPLDVASQLAADVPEAVICYDDKLALALLDGLRFHGLVVPDDVAVVGFDGIPFAALSNPRLTTVSASAAEMGRSAASSLVAAVGGGRPAAPRVLPVELIVRESSSHAAVLTDAATRV